MSTGGYHAADTSPTYAWSAGTYWLVANPRGAPGNLRLVLPQAWASAAPADFGVWT